MDSLAKTGTFGLPPIPRPKFMIIFRLREVCLLSVHFFFTNKSKSGDGEFLLTMCKLLLCLQYSSDYIFFLMFECEYFRKFDFSFVLCNLLISIEYEIIN